MRFNITEMMIEFLNQNIKAKVTHVSTLVFLKVLFSTEIERRAYMSK